MKNKINPSGEIQQRKVLFGYLLPSGDFAMNPLSVWCCPPLSYISGGSSFKGLKK